MSNGPLHGASESTSRSLLRRARARDAEAWQRLSHVYGPLVYQWCRQFGCEPNDAADIVQEVFRLLAQGLDRFDGDRPGATFRGWLWTIARHRLLDAERRKKRRPAAVGGSSAQQQFQAIPDDCPSEHDPEERRREQSALVDRALALMRSDFEPRTWQAFWKTTIEDQSAADAGRELEMSVAAVYKAKSRVLRRLREELAGLDVID